MTTLPNPLVAGFHPDPSVVQVGEDYYLATSTFEYMPGIPIHHSRNLVDWELIGHVCERSDQLQLSGVPTSGGVWAPTIRYRDGTFFVIVADAMGRGMLLFTASDPAGPWDDGLSLSGIEGVDPDLAWDDEGICLVTYSGLPLDGPPDAQNHHGIMQARYDLELGEPLESPRLMWSGTGLMFPEAPHLYHIDDWWYLVIAEGGTERGHAVSVARSRRPDGDFEGCPSNPVLSARSTDRPIQNTGHGDLVVAPDGSWHFVMLGMRTRGATRSFSPLGRETFGTEVEWADGWPTMTPVELDPERVVADVEDGFRSAVPDREWIAVRRLPTDVATIEDGCLRIVGEDRAMEHPEPTFIGRRQRMLYCSIEIDVSECSGIGGLSLRYDENFHVDLELDGDELVARSCVPTMVTEHRRQRPHGPVTLVATMTPPPSDVGAAMPSDLIRLSFRHPNGADTELAVFDGRMLSAEVCCSFTGRVVGAYCTTGTMTITRFSESAI